MLRVNWLRSLSGVCGQLSRRQRRVLASRRRRRAGTTPLPCVQKLETRTLLAAPNPLALSSLDGTTGFRLDGDSALVQHRTGYSVSSAGDINGDGFDDLIIATPFADLHGQYSGASYVVFGESGSFTSAMDLTSLDGTTGFRLDGVDQGDRAGGAVSGAGDVNGDGFDDLVVGARAVDTNGGDPGTSGASYVLFGRSAGFASVINLSTLNGTTGFRLDGAAAGDQTGSSVSTAGDLNGDGHHDLLIGAFGADNSANNSGSSYVVFGRTGGFASVINLSTLDGMTGFRLDGAGALDRFGRAASSVGDVNGDGFDDLTVAAYGADPNGNYSGSSYVLFGGSHPFSSAINVSTLDGTTGFRLDGAAAEDRSGRAVSGAGDVNGDGIDDLIIGAYAADPNGAASGSSYVVFGRSVGITSAVNLSTLDGTTGFRLDGVAALDWSGRAVSGAGDVNGDGFDDLLVGAPFADPGGDDFGSSYVVFGGSGGFASVINLGPLNGNNGFRLDGEAMDDFSGRAVSGAGDVNGDGFDDIIIGAYRADPNGNFSDGSSYVIFGGNFTGGAETQVGGDGAQTLNATLGAGVDILIGGRGNDTLISDGGDDVLRGGEGDDILAIPDANFSPRRLVGGTGTDTVRLDGAGITFDLTVIADNRLLDIEQIDLAGSGANRLILTRGELLRLSSSSNTLTVTGNAGDRVQIPFGDHGWSLQGIVNLEGTDFQQYTNGAATLNVEVDVETAIGVLELSSLDGSNGFVLPGIDPLDRSGVSVSSAGDVNGDGFEDLIIGADSADQPGGTGHGETYVVFGKSGGFGSSFALSSLNGTNGFIIRGIDPNDKSGYSVSSAGDVNGDGFGDLIIGADRASDGPGTFRGESYVVFGKLGGFSSSLELSSLDGTNGFLIPGLDDGDRSGLSVSTAGDINGDGFDDVIVGAFAADQTAGDSREGEAYVIFGHSGAFAASIVLDYRVRSAGGRVLLSGGCG